MPRSDRPLRILHAGERLKIKEGIVGVFDTNVSILATVIERKTAFSGHACNLFEYLHPRNDARAQGNEVVEQY